MSVIEVRWEASLGPDPYGQDVRVIWTGPGDEHRERPAFWDGDAHWACRFAAPRAGQWQWSAHLRGQVLAQGEVTVDHAVDGPWRMDPSGRNVVDSAGKLIFPVVDTAWALPYRATLAEAEHYASRRAAQGFTAALLMAIQPDCGAEGSDDRTQPLGFGRGFLDLHEGTLRRLNPAYFQHLDALIGVLRGAGIAPVWSPLFFGYGWRGLHVIGPRVAPEEAARFATYLAARYGAEPGLWLAGADGTGWEPAVAAMGEALYREDVGPVGIHYNPWQSDDAHADADWCAFHLSQTGHNGVHLPERVAEQRRRHPHRGVANGEPTYEGLGGGRRGLGAWQREEAWGNLVCGGTMGVFYGAAAVWQWQRADDLATWDTWATGPWDWRAGLELAGARYPGVVGRVVRGMDLAGMVPDREIGRGARAVSAPGRGAVVWLALGSGTVHPWASSSEWPERVRAEVFDPESGDALASHELVRAEGDEWMGITIPSPWGDGAESPVVVRLTPVNTA